MEEMIKKKLDFTYIKKSLMKLSREGERVKIPTILSLLLPIPLHPCYLSLRTAICRARNNFLCLPRRDIEKPAIGRSEVIKAIKELGEIIKT